MAAARPAVVDRVVHEPARLAIVSVLASRREASFPDLRDLLDMSDGNLSVHLRTLEQAGYVSIAKAFIGRKPRTTVRLTPVGRAALDRYLDALEALLKQARRR